MLNARSCNYTNTAHFSVSLKTRRIFYTGCLRKTLFNFLWKAAGVVSGFELISDVCKHSAAMAYEYNKRLNGQTCYPL